MMPTSPGIVDDLVAEVIAARPDLLLPEFVDLFERAGQGLVIPGLYILFQTLRERLNELPERLAARKRTKVS